MTESDCKKHFGDNAEKYAAAVVSGFNDYHAENAHTSHKHSRRTRANIIHDNIVNRAKQLEIPADQFRFIKGLPRNFFDIGQKILVQFKKLGRTLLSSNHASQLHLALQEFNKVICLPGIPDRLPLVTIGYVPSHDFTKIDGVFATYVQKNKLQWAFQLDISEPNVQPLPLPLPLTPPDEQSQPQKIQRRRVTARGARKQRHSAPSAGV
jgi:hypothetical protein